MLKTLLAAAAGAALVSGLNAAALAQPKPENAELAERLVACDVAMFLDSQPDFSSQRMYAIRQLGTPPELLLGPDFLGPDRWHSEDLETGYRMLRARGAITYDDVVSAYERVGYPVLREYSRRHRRVYTVPTDIRREARECARFARDVRRGELSS